MTLAAPAPQTRPRKASEGPMRRNSTLFKRVSAEAMGIEAGSICHKSHWVPKSTRSTCSNCKESFKLFNTKHHCRLCGEIVCGPCSTKRILFEKKSVRSCDQCVDQSVFSVSHKNRGKNSRDLQGEDDSSSNEDTAQPRKSLSRNNTKYNSESNVLTASTRSTVGGKVHRERGRSQPAVMGPSPVVVDTYRPMPHEQSWRLQLPYVIVLLLMAIAGVTNVLAVL